MSMERWQDFGDDLPAVDIGGSGSVTTRDLTDEELEEAREREKRRVPLGFASATETVAPPKQKRS